MDLKLYKYKNHILELKRRIIYCLLFFVGIFIFSFIYKKDLLEIVIMPLKELGNFKFIYTNLLDGFFAYINICFLFSLICAINFIFLQIFLFIKPGLYKFELLIAKIILLLSPILFISGILFVYFFVIPKAWIFFYNFQDHNLILLPNITEYINLSKSIFTGFIICFQMPIFIIILYVLNIISIQQLKNLRRIMIFINFVLAGIVTPPDVLSQFMLAIPLIFMYEFSIIICKIIQKHSKRLE